jgi:ESCRT-II complex subunit VPS25
MASSSSSLSTKLKRNESGRLEYKGFEFPQCYEFPPFFTVQPVQATRHKQESLWCSLILDFARHFRVYTMDVREMAAKSVLFRSDEIHRYLDARAIVRFLDVLAARGNVEWIDDNGNDNNDNNSDKHSSKTKSKSKSKSKSLESGDDAMLLSGKRRCRVLWRTRQEWADMLHKWAVDTGHVNVVLTVWDLREGDESQGQEFAGLDAELMLEALQLLERAERAVVFTGNESDQRGVKFFQV